MSTIFKKLKASLLVRWVTLSLVFAIGIGGVGYGINEALVGVDRAQEVQIERCEAGNKVRVGLQQYFIEQLAEVKSHGVKYYEQFLGHNEEALRQLRRESIQNLERDVNIRFAPENCEVKIK